MRRRGQRAEADRLAGAVAVGVDVPDRTGLHAPGRALRCGYALLGVGQQAAGHACKRGPRRTRGCTSRQRAFRPTPPAMPPSRQRRLRRRCRQAPPRPRASARGRRQLPPWPPPAVPTSPATGRAARVRRRPPVPGRRARGITTAAPAPPPLPRGLRAAVPATPLSAPPASPASERRFWAFRSSPAAKPEQAHRRASERHVVRHRSTCSAAGQGSCWRTASGRLRGAVQWCFA